ncbi:MAG: hypothetical protein IKE20_04345 [Eggerthellaceae bacterium]|nr:hypothetical protein [Eggerthellaceae bacterium]
MANYIATDGEFAAVADAIREKGGTSAALEWPTGFADAIGAISGGGGNDFIVTVSWDDSTQLWEPDCTVYEWQDAYTGGKNIAIECSDGYAVNWLYDDDYVFVYIVYSWDGNSLKESYYIFTVDGVENDGYTETIVPAFDSPTRTYTPTTSQQTDTITYDPNDGYNGIEQVSVTVNAMPTGTAGTPTATKGSVSNHSVSVTPKVTNTTGYITGGTKTGTAVTVSASELVSGSETKTANGTYDVTNLASVVVNVSGGSGGASNFVHGTFTTQSSAGAQTVTIPYTGSGYPIMACIVVNGGMYDSSNTAWYNKVQRYAIGMWEMTKADMSVSPTYSTSGAANYGVVNGAYKSGSSSATSYARAGGQTINSYSSSNAAANLTTAVRFKSATTMSVYVNTSNYGLMPGLEYEYFVAYSS